MGQNDFYVMSRFSDLLPYSSSEELAKLSEEVTEFQLLSDENIPQHVWDDALVKSDENGDGGYYRQDVLWQYLSTLKSSDGRQMFKRLSKIAMLVLVIPHSNASEERVFSMVRKNKTPFRPSLSLDNTLPSILTVKLATEEPCHKFEPHSSVVNKAGKVTWQYNKQHRKTS